MADPDNPVPGVFRWSRGERIVAIAGVLLAADLVLLPFHHYSLGLKVEEFGIEVPSFRIDLTGLEDPYKVFGIAALVVVVGMVLHILTARVTPAVPPPGQIHLVAGAVVLGLVAAKMLANHDFLGVGAWLALALAAGVAYGGFLLGQEASAASGTRATRA